MNFPNLQAMNKFIFQSWELYILAFQNCYYALSYQTSLLYDSKELQSCFSVFTILLILFLLCINSYFPIMPIFLFQVWKKPLLLIRVS